MRLPKFEYLSPQTIEEACSLLFKHGDKAQLLAGGTDLLNKMKERKTTPEFIIGLRKIKNLDYIEADKEGLRIGALTTINTIDKSSIIKEKFPCLSEVPGLMATVQIRNMATIGGNLCNAAPSADTAPMLICLGAKAKIVGPEKERVVALEDFFTGPGKTVLDKGEILAEIQVPYKPPYTGGAYFKVSRVAVDLAIVGVAALVSLDSKDGVCKEVKITLGAVAPTPIRAKKAEGLLKGKKIDSNLIEQAGRAASEEARPITDVRGTVFYRTEMVNVLTKRAIGKALVQAK